MSHVSSRRLKPRRTEHLAPNLPPAITSLVGPRERLARLSSLNRNAIMLGSFAPIRNRYFASADSTQAVKRGSMQ
jgi:hypothetical protein